MHGDFVQNNAIARGYVLDQHMNTGIQTKDQPGVSTIQNEVTARQQDFAWS
jgi:hypothetical protein